MLKFSIEQAELDFFDDKDKAEEALFNYCEDSKAEELKDIRQSESYQRQAEKAKEDLHESG